jgi:polyhydroxybutyrate depolymerase
MHQALLLITVLTVFQAQPLKSGDHKRWLTVDSIKRSYWIHVPEKYDPKTPTPVVLVLHGAMMDGKMMEAFTGMNETADQHKFIAVYPSGTGPGNIVLTWNAGTFPGEKNNRVDDVKFLGKVLDDIEGVLNVNKKRVYSCGLSNGAMMSYRLANEMSDRIAAIATVAGTIALDKYEPKRPVPVLHIHGTKDTLVPYNGPDKKKDPIDLMKFKSAPDTLAMVLKANGCGDQAAETKIDTKADKLQVVRKEYRGNADVVFYVVEGGGHTWPGVVFVPVVLGASTSNIIANDVIWEFFERHPHK